MDNHLLKGRTQRVKINDFVSQNLIKCTSGVSQSNHLGPLFFLVYINDISTFKSFRVWQYADYMKIALRIKYINDSLKIQSNVSELGNWCLENKLYLNVGKCKVFCVYRISTLILFDYVIWSKI